jgi:hypothetical protein
VALRRAHTRQVKVRKKQGYADMGRVQITVGGTYLSALSRAAAARGLSPTAYMRRAVAAFIAADTDTPIGVFLRDCPHPDGPGHGTYDDGAGHGSWAASRFADDTDVT